MKTLNTCVVTLTLLAVAAAAQAQQASTKSCNGRDPVGYIGITGISCNCTISSNNDVRDWSFRTEPKILSLSSDSRSASALRVGDVITAVNEHLITTREGAQEFANIKPGVPVVLTLRRDGEIRKVALTPEAVCPNDDRYSGMFAPRAPRTPRPPRPAPAISNVPTAPEPAALATPDIPVPSVGNVPPVPPVPPAPPVNFGMGLSCRNCRMSYGTPNSTWVFSTPPEVYSIERGGPADKAGIQRGDVITHVNGKPIVTAEAGRMFASAKPGQVVRLTVKRNGASRTYAVKAVARSTATLPELAQSSKALDRARQSLIDLQRSQQAQIRQLQEEMRRTQVVEDEQMRNAQREMLRAQRQHEQQLNQLSLEMARAERQMHAAIVDSSRAVCSTTSVTSASPRARTLRYTGTLGDAEIEVRGANPVSVTEDGDQVVITTGATVVRVQKKK